MVDVGGQRSERRRWFECFDGVTSILFLVSSSEFDQVLMEDRQTNRLSESLNIFETIVNNRVFSNVSIILFLNKTDLLEEKVKTISIRDYFPQYEGNPHELSDVQQFLVQCFRDKRRDQQHKPLYHHFTTAINTENIRLVFRDVKDTILHDNLKQLMLQWHQFSSLILIFGIDNSLHHCVITVAFSSETWGSRCKLLNQINAKFGFQTWLFNCFCSQLGSAKVLCVCT